jgi:hypothetical protein
VARQQEGAARAGTAASCGARAGPAYYSVPAVPVLVALAWGWHRGGAGGDEVQEGVASLVARGYRGSAAAG